MKLTGGQKRFKSPNRPSYRSRRGMQSDRCRRPIRLSNASYRLDGPDPAKSSSPSASVPIGSDRSLEPTTERTLASKRDHLGNPRSDKLRGSPCPRKKSRTHCEHAVLTAPCSHRRPHRALGICISPKTKIDLKPALPTPALMNQREPIIALFLDCHTSDPKPAAGPSDGPSGIPDRSHMRIMR